MDLSQRQPQVLHKIIEIQKLKASIQFSLRRTYLKSIDRFFGFLFGIARGILIIILMFITYVEFDTISENLKIIEKSRSEKILSLYQDQINQFIPKGFLDGVSKQYEELTFICKTYP